MTDLDPRFTFDSFVVGPANRLASAAARRAADSPGTSYNPLFVYAASGLGKSHILTAIAHQSGKSAPDSGVLYMTLESYLEELATALQTGTRDSFKEKYGELDILLLDDVQFLTGQAEAQEMLLRTLDQLSTAGSQIVLASDRPPAEINGLDARLLSRFSGGLIVDIGPPEYETRVAIIRKKTEERGQTLQEGVAEALARYPVKNVRELGGALNKVLATQDLEQRQVTAEELAGVMGEATASSSDVAAVDDFGSFLNDLTETVAETVEEQEEPWRQAVREAVDSAEREGFSAKRLRGYLGGSGLEGWEDIVGGFVADLDRLREINEELDRLGNPWPDAAQGVLKDPDHIEEAEALLTSVRERQRPFPKLGDGPTLDEVEDFPNMAVKAAHQLVAAERPEYNPLYVWASKPELGRTLLGAAGRTFQVAMPDARMAVTSVKEFAEDFIRALSEGVAGAWRERWWTVDLLLVHGIQALSETERAQDEFFHLFEALKRRGARVMLAADRPPAGIRKIDERLRSRFEGGLVIEVSMGEGTGELELVAVREPHAKEAIWGGDTEAKPTAVIPPLEELDLGERAGLFIDRSQPTPIAALSPPAAHTVVEAATRRGGAWFPSAENVVLNWPRIESLLQEELE